MASWLDMRFGFALDKLCGSVYRAGDVVFTPDGNSVLAPVGNRVTKFDLLKYVIQGWKGV